MPQNQPQQLLDTTQDAGLAQKFNPVTENIHKNYHNPTKNSVNLNPTGPTAPVRLFNWTKDKLDKRDYIYPVRSGVAQSTTVDLRPFCSPVEDQGNLGSCVGHAISSAMEVLLKRQNRMIELSRLFIYYQSRLLEGTTRIDAGAYIRDGIKVCYTWGAPAETLWKYNIRQFTVKPSNAAYTDALRRKVTLYQRCADFNAVKNAIQTGNPVVVGFLVYNSFMSSFVAKTGNMTYPNIRSERLLGGHAVCLVGFDDSRQVFIAKNSWGAAWGDRGYFYMPYQVIKNPSMSSDFWVVSAVS